jgi:hypothetical protein
MRTTYLILLITTIFITSCDEETNGLTVIEGIYEGTFIRSSPTAYFPPSQVTLTFSNGQFQGESEKTKYPAICSGTYDVKGNNIDFTNTCVWTAEFDWTLILSGEFSIGLANDELTLQKKNGSIWDLYQLKRKKNDR